MEDTEMDRKNLEADLIRKQNQYIRQLEEQLAVYKEKDTAQELLIEKLNQTLDLFAEEISRAKKKEGTGREE